MSCEEKSTLINQKYEIERTIGRGTFGTVYCVRDINSYQTYALKEILLNDENEINTAMREAFHYSSLKHENLVEIKSVFVRNGTNSMTRTSEFYVCILMHLYQHGDLAEDMKKRLSQEKFFTESEILDLMIQISRGVQYLYSKGFMHRDLKPGNIFLSSDMKTIAIGDLGLARKMDNTFASTVAGTLKYMAPEVLSAKQYSYGADIWSLGCIFFEMTMLQLDRNLYMDIYI
jgi:serine/threonine protein kinase